MPTTPPPLYAPNSHKDGGRVGTGSTCPRQPVPGGWGQTAAWFPELVGAGDLPRLPLPIPMGQRKWKLGQQQQDSLRLALRLEGKIRAPGRGWSLWRADPQATYAGPSRTIHHLPTNPTKLLGQLPLSC